MGNVLHLHRPSTKLLKPLEFVELVELTILVVKY